MELAQALGKRGMAELLGALAETLKRSTRRGAVDVLAMAAQAKINQAAGRDISAQQRDKLLEEGARLLETLIERTRDATGPKKLMEHFRFRFQLAELHGIVQAEPHAVRLLFLQDAPEDRKIVREQTGKACELLDKLEPDIEAAIEELRLRRRRLESATPQLEDFQKKVRYKAAWVCFYRGMSLPDTPEHRKERRKRLNTAIDAVEEWAEGDPGSGVKYWSLLLRGMAYRELGQFKPARDSLEKAAAAQGAGAEKVVRMRAYFEIARTFIEAGDFRRGETAIGVFRAKVLEMYERQGEYAVDLYAALLWDYSYHRQAELAANDAKKAAALRQKALLALLHVPAKYSDWAEQADWAEAVRRKYGADANTDPAVLYAEAVGLLQKWRGLRDKKTGVPGDLKRDALHKLDQVEAVMAKACPAGRDLVRPMVLWRKAFCMNWERRNDEAGELFLEIAKDTDHPLARKAAEYSARSYLGVIRERLRLDPDHPVHPRLRERAARALEVLLGGWAKTKDGTWEADVCRWYRELGEQHHRLAEMAADPAGKVRLLTKAIAAYDRFLDLAVPEPAEAARVREARSAAEALKQLVEPEATTRPVR